MIINNTAQPVNTENSLRSSSKEIVAAENQATISSSTDIAKNVQKEVTSGVNADRVSNSTDNGQLQSSVLDESDLDNLTKNLNESLKSLQSYLMFEKDTDTEKMVFFIKHSETDEIIRQIPAEEFLAISKNIQEYLDQMNQSSEKLSLPTGIITNQVV